MINLGMENLVHHLELLEGKVEYKHIQSIKEIQISQVGCKRIKKKSTVTLNEIQH